MSKRLYPLIIGQPWAKFDTASPADCWHMRSDFHLELADCGHTASAIEMISVALAIWPARPFHANLPEWGGSTQHGTAQGYARVEQHNLGMTIR